VIGTPAIVNQTTGITNYGLGAAIAVPALRDPSMLAVVVAGVRWALSDWLRQGRLRVRDCPAGRRLVAQARAFFPTDEHDDILDAVAQVIRLLATMVG
jgi:hypothetical protein